jgi:DNA adenine methylase
LGPTVSIALGEVRAERYFACEEFSTKIQQSNETMPHPGSNNLQNGFRDFKLNKPIGPPFGYFGAKNRIALQICQHLPPHNAWVEAFCGSSALTLAKRPAPIEVINDVDDEIVNFFRQLRAHPKDLCRVVAFTPYARKELIEARKDIGNLSDIERARRFLVRAMMAINGVFGEKKGGFSYSQSYAREGREARVNRWYKLPERLLLVADRLRSVRIEHRDARDILRMFHDRPATLIYLDPPYLAKRVNGYEFEANEKEFHEELLDLSNRSKCMIFISGYDNELYDSILTARQGWTSLTIKASTRDASGRSHPRTERVWMNRQFRKARMTNTTPVHLSKKERQVGNVNPGRK